MKSLAVLGFLLATPGAIAHPASAASPEKDATFEEEKVAVLGVIEQQAAAFWAKDFKHGGESNAKPDAGETCA